VAVLFDFGFDGDVPQFQPQSAWLGDSEPTSQIVAMHMAW
jgi:hypothetical protein